MYIKIDEELLNKIENITMTSYCENGEIPYSNLISMIEDLIYEYNCLQEKFEDYKDYVKDNYKEMEDSEKIGINNRDFI